MSPSNNPSPSILLRDDRTAIHAGDVHGAAQMIDKTHALLGELTPPVTTPSHHLHIHSTCATPGSAYYPSPPGDASHWESPPHHGTASPPQESPLQLHHLCCSQLDIDPCHADLNDWSRYGCLHPSTASSSPHLDTHHHTMVPADAIVCPSLKTKIATSSSLSHPSQPKVCPPIVLQDVLSATLAWMSPLPLPPSFCFE